MSGTVGILNVGAGDTKLTFDNKNPAETIRAGRIVRDMLRRGFALLVAVPPKNDGDEPTYVRAIDFDERTAEYIIADFDPTIAAPPEGSQHVAEAESSAAPGEGGDIEASASASDGRPRRGRPKQGRIAAAKTSAVAVGRSAGG